jgi:hypothetical protein
MPGRLPAAVLLRDEPMSLWLRLALAVEIAVTYARVRRLLARNDLTEVVATLRDGADDRLDPATARRLAKRLAHATRRTLRLLRLDARCLPVSLVLLRLMARRDASCALLIGARSEPWFEAHAWVEHAGRPVLPTLGYASLIAI